MPETSTTVPVDQPGYTALLIGHSFFQPVATKLTEHAFRAGFLGHRQTVVFGGGDAGAPEAFWNDTVKRSEIRAYLSTGKIELFGMTYHPQYPTLTGYRLWVEEALSHNPDTVFFFAMPWLLEPASMTAATYASEWRDAYDTIATPIVQQLAQEYPTASFFAIPYGRAATDLYELFDRGELPGIDALVGDPRSSLFRDFTGHAGEIIDELAALVWGISIYCIDVNTYPYRPRYEVDLLAMAADIVADQNPADTAPWCRAA